MKKKIILLLFFCIASHVTHAHSSDHATVPVLDKQEDQLDTYIPDPGNYSNLSFEFCKMDYLFNLNKPSSPFHSMKKFDFRSLIRGNMAFLYAVRIKKSLFALCLGVGWSNLHYAFAGKNHNGTVTYRRLKKGESKTDCEDIKNEDRKKVSYSALKVPFIDFLLRLRFNSVLENPKAGFHGWIGLKLGLRQRAAQILNYKEYDDVGASSIHNSHFNLRLFHFGCQAGVGYSRFGLIGGFNFTSLFEQKKGPAYSDGLRPFSFSLYVDLI